MTWGRSSSHAACVAWARALPDDAEVSLFDVQARLILEDRRLLEAVTRQTVVHHRTEPETDDRLQSRWRRRAAALWSQLTLVIVLAVTALPLLGVVLLPSRRTPDRVERIRLEMLTDFVTIAFTFTAILYLLLLAIWAVRPLALHGSCLRVAHVVTTIIAAVIYAPYFGLAFLLSGGQRGGWPLLIMTITAALAYLNLMTVGTSRSDRQAVASGVRQVARILREDPDLSGDLEDVRGPARELRRVLRRVPEEDREALERCRDSVMDVLAARGMVDADRVGRVRALPFEQMHDAAGEVG